MSHPGAPNLDAQPISELRQFIARVNDGPRKVAAELFPAKPRGYVRATRDLLRYAQLKLTAMVFREKGAVVSALHFEAACDALYKQLPDFARW